MKRCITPFILSLAALAIGPSVQANPVAYTNAPLSNIIAQLNQKYGIHIVLEGALANNPGRLVTFSAGEMGVTPTRLQVINSLANAAGVTFQKGFGVSKIADGETPPQVPLDSKGYIYFKSTTVPARDAILAIATTDNATAQIAPDITGDVTLSENKLTAPEAAKEVADQTHTMWRAYYALMPLNMAQKGRVVGHNASGQAIIELPFTTYIHPAPPTPAATDSGTAGTGTTAAAGTATPPAVGSEQVPNSGVGVYPGPYDYAPSLYGGQMPFSYGDNYGYTPYGAGPYPYQYGGFGYGNGVGIMPGQGGYGPFGGYGAPVTF